MENKYERAKELYHHGEYDKAIELILEILQNNEIKYGVTDYENMLTYLGDCRYNIFLKEGKNKSLLFEAITDYASASNSYYINQGIISKDLQTKIENCLKQL